MAADKRRKLKRLRRLPERVQRLLTFGIYAASFEVPRERRAPEMVEALDWLIDLLHANGYTAPLWLVRPKWYYSRGVDLRGPMWERPTSGMMLDMVESIVADLPEAERSEAMRELLHLFAGIYNQGGTEPPEWLRVGLDWYAEDDGEELPPDLMLDVLDASVLNLPEEHRAAARHSILEHYEAMYRGTGKPIPEWVRVGLDGAPPAL
ncbi:MAG: hypothetical protein ABW277_09085 [Longimicrobiaceae bacterium]